MANFTRDAEKAYSTLRIIHSDFRELEAQASSTSTKTEARIRQNLQKFTSEIDAISNFPKASLYKLLRNKSEQDRRERVILELEDTLALFQRKLKNITNPSYVEMMPKSESSFTNLSDDAFGQHQKPMLQEQDKTIDELIGSASKLKVIGENLGQELDLHLHLINDLEKNVDSTTIKLNKIEARIVRLLNSSSNSCLVCVIFILSVLFILVIVYT